MSALESWRYICDAARWIAIRPPPSMRREPLGVRVSAEVFSYFAVNSAAFEENDPSAAFFTRIAA